MAGLHAAEQQLLISGAVMMHLCKLQSKGRRPDDVSLAAGSTTPRLPRAPCTPCHQSALGCGERPPLAGPSSHKAEAKSRSLSGEGVASRLIPPIPPGEARAASLADSPGASPNTAASRQMPQGWPAPSWCPELGTGFHPRRPGWRSTVQRGSMTAGLCASASAVFFLQPKPLAGSCSIYGPVPLGPILSRADLHSAGAPKRLLLHPLSSSILHPCPFSLLSCPTPAAAKGRESVMPLWEELGDEMASLVLRDLQPAQGA